MGVEMIAVAKEVAKRYRRTSKKQKGLMWNRHACLFLNPGFPYFSPLMGVIIFYPSPFTPSTEEGEIQNPLPLWR